jgi:hypothetical protein
MNTWTSLIIPLTNYLTNCQEPEAWASVLQMWSLFPSLAWPHSPFSFATCSSSRKKLSLMPWLLAAFLTLLLRSFWYL